MAKKPALEVETNAEYAKRVAAAAPPFTEEQIAKMTAIVRNARREATK